MNDVIEFKPVKARSRHLYFMSWVFLVLAMFVFLFDGANGDPTKEGFYTSVGFFVAFLIARIVRYEAYTNPVYRLLDRGVEKLYGLHHSESITLPYHRIRSIKIDPTIAGWLFGARYRDIKLDVAGDGGSDLTLRGVANPEKIKSEIERRMK